MSTSGNRLVLVRQVGFSNVVVAGPTRVGPAVDSNIWSERKTQDLLCRSHQIVS